MCLIIFKKIDSLFKIMGMSERNIYTQREKKMRNRILERERGVNFIPRIRLCWVKMLAQLV